MSAEPFPFIGDGEGKAGGTRLWLISDHAASLATLFAESVARHEGPVLELSWPTPPPRLAAHLRAAYDAAELSLVVRVGRVTGTSWHRESLKDPRVLSTLERLVQSSPQYAAQRFPLSGGRDVTAQLLRALEGRALRAEVLAATLRALLDASPGRSRAAMVARLERALPGWLGFDFGCDVVIVNLLARLRGVSPNSLATSSAFQAELARQMRAVHGAPGNGPIDWGRRDEVLAAIAAGRWTELSASLHEANDAHVDTVVSLEHQHLLALATADRTLATRLANIAAVFLPGQQWGSALRLYDAAIEGELPAMAAANPLFAVQDDNHHLGIDAPRARRYLERCLPHGPHNPAVFLNAAFVCMELEEPERALECLAAAHAGGTDLRPYRGERLFAPLQDDARFQALLRPQLPQA